MAVEIRRLTPADAPAYRALMLEGYAAEPEAFTATVDERKNVPLEWWIARVSDDPGASDVVFGAFARAELVGVAGFQPEQRPRTRHKATLIGMYVQPSARGRGVARALVEAVLSHARARPETRIMQLTVTESNTPARRLYELCGFRVFGTEPYALNLGDRFVAKVHMWRTVGPEDQPAAATR